MGEAFSVLGEENCRVPVIAHVPHSAVCIPPDVRATLVLDDEALAREVVRMTDWHTDELFGCVTDMGAVMFLNRLSRLVVDPERFREDAREPMSSRGMGAVYARTSDGGPLRDALPAHERERLLADFYDPYARAMGELASRVFERFRTCLILDCHSFPSVPLPYELDQSPDRPDICIGTDSFHTPERLAEAVEMSVMDHGFSVARNRPFGGTYIPLAFLGRQRRMASVMLEVRRGLYCDELTGRKSAGFGRTRDFIARLVTDAAAALDDMR